MKPKNIKRWPVKSYIRDENGHLRAIEYGGGVIIAIEDMPVKCDKLLPKYLDK